MLRRTTYRLKTQFTAALKGGKVTRAAARALPPSPQVSPLGRRLRVVALTPRGGLGTRAGAPPGSPSPPSEQQGVVREGEGYGA